MLRSCSVLGLRETPVSLGSPSAAVPGTVCEILHSESSSQGSVRAVLPAYGGAGKPNPCQGLAWGCTRGIAPWRTPSTRGEHS